MEYSFTDPYLLELIKEAAHAEDSSAKHYAALCDSSDFDNEQKAVFEKISQDEYKHCRMLKEIYECLNNSTVTPIQTVQCEPIQLSQSISQLVNQKTENVKQYKIIYFALPVHRFKNYLFEILLDEQCHGMLLCSVK